MDYIPIFPSTEDLERRRLESTIDQDLYSLSLGSLVTTTTSGSVDQHSSSMSTISSVEQPRGFGEGYTGRHDMSFLHPTQQQAQPRKPSKSSYGPHGTPRAAARTVSGMSGVSAMSEMESPVSTAGHHISAVTLGEGVFRRRGNGDDTDVSDAEFDPERSLGRLVGELGRTMGGKLSPRPTSPFAALSPPRSPSPFSSLQNANAGNMSFTLNRNDPLPSPPASKAGSGSSNGSRRETAARTAHSEFSNIARELGQEVHAKKRALGESTAHNVQQAANRPADKDRLRSLQGGRKSAPASTKPSGPDITGMTGLMETPAKGGQYDTLGKNGQVRHDDGSVPQALSTLQARLRALETENSLSRRRVRELEVELEKARREVDEAKSGGQSKLRDVISEKSALEDLIHSLRSHLTRITLELEQNKALVSELRESQSLPPHQSPPRSNSSVTKELVALRREVERLGNEVHRLGGIVEEGLDTRRRARGERTIRMEKEEAARMARELQAEDEMERLQRDAGPQHTDRIPPTPGPSRLARGLRTAAEDRHPPVAAGSQRRKSTGAGVRLQNPTPPTSDDGFDSPSPPPSQNALGDGLKSQQDRRSKSARAKRNSSIRSDGPGSPFPSIRDEDEGDFFSVLHKDDLINLDGDEMPATKTKGGRAPKPEAGTGARDVPPQTVLVRVVGELEADFLHYKAIYSELADQYKVLDAASDVSKRRVLAEHLKEVIDTLEQKADQIAALYHIVSFSDKPVTGGRSVAAAPATHRSVPDIMRLVRDSLGEEALRRLKEDGLRPHSRRQHCVI